MENSAAVAGVAGNPCPWLLVAVRVVQFACIDAKRMTVSVCGTIAMRFKVGSDS
jgi:hypothetical protein